MGERLKQIWTGFEATTTRSLTGGGVDNIIVPHRADYASEDGQFLPEDYEAPAERAFGALNEEIKASKKKIGAGRKTKSRSMTPAPMETQRFGGDELIRGLRATAMRVERTDIDYESFLASAAGKAVFKRARKKRFGIF